MGRPRFSLVVFDKGGTLIDFRAMWCDWAIEIARRLAAQVSLSIADRFFVAIGFDPRSGYIDPLGKLAVLPVSGLRALTPDVLAKAGLERGAAEATVACVWFTPDPVASVRPLADLPALFRTLRERGVKIAIATMDGRASTEGGLAGRSRRCMPSSAVMMDCRTSPTVWAACRAMVCRPAHGRRWRLGHRHADGAQRRSRAQRRSAIGRHFGGASRSLRRCVDCRCERVDVMPDSGKANSL
jgi:hypothetical protein